MISFNEGEYINLENDYINMFKRNINAGDILSTFLSDVVNSEIRAKAHLKVSKNKLIDLDLNMIEWLKYAG